jgi:transcriptional regulator with XRE-family HTH domain
MIERIEQIIKEYNLSPSKLADKLGVQRSGISHILAGRNKPSYDFLTKSVELFPEIDANWLLTGAGNMFLDEQKQSSGLFDNVTSNQGFKSSDNVNLNTSSPLDHTQIDNVYKSKQGQNSNEIDSIVIFYKEGHFKRYIQD